MLDYCPKQGKQNSKHKAHARRATRTRAPSATRRTPTPHGRHQPQGYTPQCRPQHAPTRPYSTVLSPSTSRETRTRTPNRAPAFEAGVSTIPPHWPCKCPTVFYGKLVPPVEREPTRPTDTCFELGKTRGERKQTRETTTRPQCAQPAGHTHTSHTTGQPNPRARTLSTGPPRPAQLTHQHREHPDANTQAPPAHTQRTIQCRHTPQRDSTRSREHPHVVSAPRSA